MILKSMQMKKKEQKRKGPMLAFFQCLILLHLIYLNPILTLTLTLTLRIGLLGLLRNGGEKFLLPKTCHTYPTMIKGGTLIAYIKKIQERYKSRGKSLNPSDFADIGIFLPKISKFCYIKKYRYRLYFDILFLIF